jgi:hypothetical protein
VDTSILDQFCKDNGFIGWFETSAKEENGNVNESCQYIINEVLKSTPSFDENTEERSNIIEQKNEVVDQKCTC